MMKNVIRKILKEEFNPDDLTSPEINMSPDTELHVARSKYGWSAYIPQISKRIYFSINPEAWNLSAGVSEQSVESKGHGSFGDDSHPEFKEYNLINTTNDEYYTPYYNPKTEKITHLEDGDYEIYNIKDGVEGIKNYSDQSRKITIEFKKNVEKLFSDYNKNINDIISNSDFAGDDYYSRRIRLADINKEGDIKHEDDFEKTSDGWYNQSIMFRNELEKKNREL